jgi:hypothetical protein
MTDIVQISARKQELLQRIRPSFGLAALWPLLRLPGEVRTNWGMPSPFRPWDTALTFIPKSHAMWLDRHPSAGGSVHGDGFTLLCRLRACDPDQPTAAVINEFLLLAVAGGVIPSEELSATEEHPDCRNVGIAESTENMTLYDTCRVRAREEQVAESGPVIREAELIEKDRTYVATSPIGDKLRATASGKVRKSADDLFVLIPADEPILQADLSMSARCAGINEKVQRVLIAALIDSHKVFIWKVRREKSKSAVGYSRRPQPID